MPETKPIRVCSKLHAKIKVRASSEEISLKKFCETALEEAVKTEKKKTTKPIK